MARLNLTLPDKLKAVIDERVAAGEYSGAAEYVSELVRRDQQRHSKRKMEQRLLRRLDRSSAVEVDSADFAQMRRKLLRRAPHAKRT
jgi:antitoxin ParD1/3/4